MMSDKNLNPASNSRESNGGMDQEELRENEANKDFARLVSEFIEEYREALKKLAD